jgi:hypothetical protein
MGGPMGFLHSISLNGGLQMVADIDEDVLDFPSPADLALLDFVDLKRLDVDVPWATWRERERNLLRMIQMRWSVPK